MFESAIDLLSYATLIKRKVATGIKKIFLSLAGIYMPQKDIAQSKVPIALTQCLEDYPQIKTIYLHLDNDRAGRLASTALRTVINSPYNVRDAPPPYGKDCNEYLLSLLGEKNKESERSFER